MFGRRTSTGSQVRWGGVLLEILLAIALFAGAAAFALGTLRSALASIDQTRRHQQAVDLARSKMAELEAGLINLSDLQGVTGSPSDSIVDEKSASVAESEEKWSYEVKTFRTEFAGLSLVELTVRENVPGPPQPNAVHYTLRQLMSLRAVSAEEYEADELIPESGST